MKRTLIFHFYVQDDFEKNLAYKMHFECLSRYAKIFDTAIFHLTGNEKYFKEIECTLCSMDFKDISFKLRPNDEFCEVSTFKEEIYDKDFISDDAVFFMHVKGVSDLNKGSNYADNILHWIWALYFYSLESDFVNEMEMKLFKVFDGRERCFYGPIMLKNRYLDIGFYPGTAYWLNCNKIHNLIKQKEIDIPLISSRTYCEQFPSYFNYRFLSGHLELALYDGVVWHYDADWDFVANYYSEKERFHNGFKEITEKIGFSINE